jgi:hypothetical protein
MKRLTFPTRQARNGCQAACTFLRKVTSPYDHGLKVAGRVVHARRNADTVRDLNTRGWVRRLTNRDMARHFAGDVTYYFAADGRVRTPETLVMVDVDCHRTGTYAAAVAFAEHLRDTLFPNLYFEPSTNGNGVHAYLVLDKQGFGDERTHQLFGMLDKALKDTHAEWQAEKPDLVVELVEVKGHPPRLGWGNDRRLQDYTSGQLAKLPREADRRWDELRHTTRIDERRVSDLYRWWRTNHEPRKQVTATAKSGSVTGHVVDREALDRFDAYRHIAHRLLPEPLKTSGREVATAEDLAILVLILEACTRRMNADGSMPTARIEANWQALYESGGVERPFNPKRYACLRDYLSRKGLLDWQDESYLPHLLSTDGKGKAAKWRAGERLLAMIEEERTSVVFVGKYGGGSIQNGVLERYG